MEDDIMGPSPGKERPEQPGKELPEPLPGDTPDGFGAPLPKR
jgi:hypothetical protein